MRNILDSIVIPKRYRGRTLRPTINIRKIGAIGNETIGVYPGDLLKGTIYFDYDVPVEQHIDFLAAAEIGGWAASCWAAGNDVILSGSGSTSITTDSTGVLTVDLVYYNDWYNVIVYAMDYDTGDSIAQVAFPHKVYLYSPIADIDITNIKDWIIS